MPEVKLDFQTILLVVAVILLLAQMVSTLNSGRKNWRELSGADRRSQEMNQVKERITALETDMNDVKGRLDAGENNFRRISQDTAQILDALDGLLMHFISGNDKEKLKEVKSSLDKYKNNRQ